MRIGLVLAGGFAKGAYQVGALRALEKFIPRSEICCISAASIGTLNAYGYATDNMESVEKLWQDVVEPGERRIVTAIMRDNALQKIVSNLEDGTRTLPMPLYCPYLNWRNSTLIYQDLSEVEQPLLKKYLRAAPALPPYSSAITIGDASYYDGGLVDNIPVAPLVDVDLDYVICFYFDESNYQFENAYFDNRIIKISFAATSMLSHSFILTREKIDEMIREGYDFTMEKLSTYFANGIEDLDYIYKTIEQSNRSCTKPARRLTVDVVISNLNRVTQKLTKRQKKNKE